MLEAFIAPISKASGWILGRAYRRWKHNQQPFKQDRDRFNSVLGCFEPCNLYYFRDVAVYDALPTRIINALDNAEHRMREERVKAASYLDDELREKEEAFLVALSHFNDEVSHRSWVNRKNHDICTIYWDSFKEWDAEDERKIREVIDTLRMALDAAIQAFEDYRNFGNKLFAERIAS